MSPAKQVAKKHAKAGQRRRLTAQGRLAWNRGQEQHAAQVLAQVLDDLGLPEELAADVAVRLRSQQQLLGKIVGVMFPHIRLPHEHRWPP